MDKSNIGKFHIIITTMILLKLLLSACFNISVDYYFYFYRSYLLINFLIHIYIRVVFVILIKRRSIISFVDAVFDITVIKNRKNILYNSKNTRL